MSNTYAAFRYEWRAGNQREACYCEGILERVGRPGDEAFLLNVSLVRDEMALPTDGFPLLDPERRTGQRVYVTSLRSRDDERVRLLAYLAPVEGHRLAFTLMWNAMREHQDAVNKLGDEWLIKTMSEEPKRLPKKKARKS